MAQFEDVTRVTGAGEGTLVHVTWGCGIVDFDNDGYRDLFVACGHLQDNVEKFDSTTSYHARNLVLREQRKRPVRRRFRGLWRWAQSSVEQSWSGL